MAATRVPLLGAAACLAGLAGCATFTETIQSTEVSLARHQPQAALAAYKKRTPAGADRVLDLMNIGMLERMVGDFDGSTGTLEEAKDAIEGLRALSLREQGLSVTVNDAAKSFIGEDFEQDFLAYPHCFSNKRFPFVLA